MADFRFRRKKDEVADRIKALCKNQILKTFSKINPVSIESYA